VVVPYVPGRAAVQLAKSTLDSKMTVTGPPPSLGMTTAVLGVKLVDEVVWIVQKHVVWPSAPEALVVQRVIVAGPTTVGKYGTLPFK
jgi:hypothetical protein